MFISALSTQVLCVTIEQTLTLSIAPAQWRSGAVPVRCEHHAMFEQKLFNVFGEDPRA
jgi:hypothetical protein